MLDSQAVTARKREDDDRPRGVLRAHKPSEDELMELMISYQGGDVAAFEGLYRAVATRIRGYLLSLARDATRADDLLQETFLQVHRARRTYQPGRPVKPWLYAIARNVFLMHRRSAVRRSRREVIADDELPEFPVPDGADAVEARRTLETAVRALGSERCEALLLHHLGGLSFKEVGAVMGISEGAAKVRAHRVMAELRELLAGQGDHGE